MRLFRWLGIGIGSLAGLCLVAYGVVYVVSERAYSRTFPVPAATIAVPTDADAVTDGRRLATIRGCFAGCHGSGGQGQVMFDQPAIARIVAPSIVAAVRKYTPEQFATIVRNGVRPDGKSMLVMPSETFHSVTDEDMGRIIAFFRSLPAVDGFTPSIEFGPVGRLGLAIGQFKMASQLVAETEPLPAVTDAALASGRYLSATVCSECHGTTLHGASNPDFTSPDLVVVQAYSAEQFTTLLRTGVAVGGRQLGVMRDRSRDNLSRMTDEEIASVYAYLRGLPPAKRG